MIKHGWAISESHAVVEKGINLPNGLVSSATFEIVIGFFSILLTGLLALLYYKQKNINELEHESNIQLEGYRAGFGNSDDFLELLLSNTGKGPAENLRIRTRPIDQPSLGDIQLEPATVPLIKELEPDSPENWIRSGRNYIGPGEKYRIFSGGMCVNINNHEKEETKRRIVSSGDFTDLDIQQIRLQVDILWEDSLGKNHEKQIIDDMLPVKDDRSLDWMISHGASYDYYEAIESNIEDESPLEMVAAHRSYSTDLVENPDVNRMRDE